MLSLLILFFSNPAFAGSIASDSFLAYQSMQCFDPGDQSHKVTIQAPSLSADWTLTLPTSGGTNTYFLQTNGSGTTTWAVPTDTGITQLTGDGTAGPGSGSQAFTLATVNSDVGSFTNADITVNAKGLVTAAASGTDAGITELTGDVTAGPGSGSQAATLATVNANVGSFTYGSFTVNAKGLITAASSGAAPVTALTVASANGFAGSFSATTTPELTLSTTVTGILSGNGTAVSAASTTGSGAVVLETSPTIVTPTIAKIANLTTNGIVYTTGSDGTLNSGPLTGDVTSSGVATTLATVNSDVGSFTNANITVNAKGLVTAAADGSVGGANASYGLSNLGIAASVSGSALTVSLKQADGSTDPASGNGAVGVDFRSSTITTGGYTNVSATGAVSVVVPSGATLGQVSAELQFTCVYALNNAGTLELFVSSNCQIPEGNVQTTTTIGTGSDSYVGMYSTTGRSNVAIRGPLAVIYSTQTTAGTWDASPSRVDINTGFGVTDPNTVERQNFVFTPNSFGTVANDSTSWWRDKENFCMRLIFDAGTPVAAAASVTLPTQVVIDVAKLPSNNDTALSSSFELIGTGVFYTGNQVPVMYIDSTGGTTGAIMFSRASATVSKFATANANAIQGTGGAMVTEPFCFPMVGWDL